MTTKTDKSKSAPERLKVTEKAYVVLEKLLEGLPVLVEDQGAQQVAFNIPSAHRAEVKATILLTAANRRLSLLKRRHRQWTKIQELKVRGAMNDRDNLEIQYVPLDDGSPGTKRRSKEERRQLAEALFYTEQDAIDELFDELEEVSIYQETVKATLKTIEHYRQDLNKYLRAVEHDDLGMPESAGDRNRRRREGG